MRRNFASAELAQCRQAGLTTRCALPNAASRLLPLLHLCAGSDYSTVPLAAAENQATAEAPAEGARVGPTAAVPPVAEEEMDPVLRAGYDVVRVVSGWARQLGVPLADPDLPTSQEERVRTIPNVCGSRLTPRAAGAIQRGAARSARGGLFAV